MTNAALQPRPERLALLSEIELDSGSHPAPPKDCDRPEGCDREIAAWILDQEWTDRAPWESPVLAAFRRRLNDVLPSHLRQRLKESMFDGLEEERERLHSRLRKLALKYGEPTRYELLEVARDLDTPTPSESEEGK